MARFSKNPKRTKPQGEVKMSAPIGANDERRWRGRSPFKKAFDITAAPPKRAKSPGVRVARMEKKNQRV